MVNDKASKGKAPVPTEAELWAKMREVGPRVGAFALFGLVYSIWTTVAHLRAAVSHPSRAARRALVLGLALDAGVSAWALGKQEGMRKAETPKQRRARLLAPPPPVSAWRWALAARDAVSLALVSSRRHGPGRAVVVGLVSYAVSVASVLIARALRPGMVELLAISEDVSRERKR